MEEFIYEVWQDGHRVAAVYSPDRYKGMAEIGHYAMQYAQDGPVKVYQRTGRKRVQISVAAFPNGNNQ